VNDNKVCNVIGTGTCRH